MSEPASVPGASRSERVDAIREDVACPHCGYNLRGLAGDVVPCPECGTRCDIAKIISRRWLGPWYKAPGYNALALPVLVLASWPFAIFVAVLTPVLLTRRTSFSDFVPGLIVVGVVFFALWLLAMRRAYRIFGDRRGLLLALFNHAILLGYLASIVMMFQAVAAFLFLTNSLLPILVGLVIGVLGFGLAYACRRGERYIAEQCIRRYLADETTVRPIPG